MNQSDQLSELAEAKCVVILAGAGVIEAGAIADLHRLATRGNIGVANTFDAKGLFAWDSPHHLGTCGLQSQDFDLLDWKAADLIITTGLDHVFDTELDLTTVLSGLTTVREVKPEDLKAMVGKVSSANAPINTLYAKIAAIAQPGFVDSSVPLHPARAVADLGQALPAGGLIAAQPGLAGLWVARTFPTPLLTSGEPRRVVVPVQNTPGESLRAAIESARQGRTTIAVITDPVDSLDRELLEVVRKENLDLVVDIWTSTPDESWLSVEDHRRNIANALSGDGQKIIKTPVNLLLTADLIAAAGPVTAWGELCAHALNAIQV